MVITTTPPPPIIAPPSHGSQHAIAPWPPAQDWLESTTSPYYNGSVVIGAHGGRGFEHCFSGYDYWDDGTVMPNRYDDVGGAVFRKAVAVVVGICRRKKRQREALVDCCAFLTPSTCLTGVPCRVRVLAASRG
jgi:hypothetical protein